MTRKITSLVLANLLNVGVTAVNGIYIARMIGPENKGILALLTTLAMIMSMLLGLGAPHASAYYIRNRPNSISEILRLISFVQVFGFVIGFVVILFSRELFSSKFIDGYFIDFAMVLLLSLTMLFSSGNGALASCVIAKGDTKYYALGTNIGSIVTLLATVVYFNFASDIVGQLHAIIFVSLIGYVVTAIIYRLRFSIYIKEIGKNVEPLKLRDFFRFGWHSQIGALSSLTFKKVDIFILGYFLNPQSVGFYSIALSLRDLALIIPRAIAGLLGGEIADVTKTEETKHRLLKKYVLMVGIIGCAISIFAYFIFPYFIPFVYGGSYVSSVGISAIVIFSLIPMSMAIVLGSGFSGFGVPLKASMASLFASVLSVPIVFLLVSQYGLLGAGVSTIVAAGFLFIFIFIFFKFHIKGVDTLIKHFLRQIKREVLHRTRESRLLNSVAMLKSEWEDIHNKSENINIITKDEKKKVLFVVGPSGLNVSSLGVETLIAKSLMLRGHECFALSCDSAIPSCEFNICGDGKNVPLKYRTALTKTATSHRCAECSLSTSIAYSAIGIDALSLCNYTCNETEITDIIANILPKKIQSFMYKGIRAGEHAFSSTLRITLRGEIDFSSNYEVWVYKRQLFSTMMVIDKFNSLLDQLKPDKVVGVHGVYLFHGAIADICNLGGVDVVIYGAPYRKGTILFSHNETYHKALINEPNGYWKNLSLTDEMDSEIDEYLASKSLGGRENVNYHPNPIFDRQMFIDELGLNPDKPIVSMFTNVIWDAQIYYQYNAFENIFDWVFSTIDYFAQNQNVQLVIRIHPAETKGAMPTMQPLFDEIFKHFSMLPSNVFIIKPESHLSSYTLAEMSKAALIYGTKMGVELAIMGIPVIVAGETFNRGKGFTFDVESKDQYFSFLDNYNEICVTDEMKSRARKFFYYFYFLKMMDFTLVGSSLFVATRSKEDLNYNFSNLNELLAGKNRTLDIICDGIIKKTKFYSDFPC